jgi:hypothetical protein
VHGCERMEASDGVVVLMAGWGVKEGSRWKTWKVIVRIPLIRCVCSLPVNRSQTRAVDFQKLEVMNSTANHHRPSQLLSPHPLSGLGDTRSLSELRAAAVASHAVVLRVCECECVLD